MKKNFWLFTVIDPETNDPVERVYRKDDMNITSKDLTVVKNLDGRDGIIISTFYLGFMTEEEFNGQA